MYKGRKKKLKKDCLVGKKNPIVSRTQTIHEK